MRTRFAPSPTGMLHIGGLRTALFAWFVAKQSKGTFFLRIEDTDQSREVAGATKNILATLAWAGLAPDEGVVLAGDRFTEKGERGPYFQSKRLALYRQYADQLLVSGHAYRCFCTTERLEQMRKEQESKKQAPMYDRHCLELTSEEIEEKRKAKMPHVVRLKIPREETITVIDDIYGSLSFKGHTIDDQVLLKSDGFPTYHLAHAVDDHLMETDIVIRGEEWLSSLPKHLLLFRFLGWQPPRYAHVPLILNKDRTKLSKRQNDVATEHYIEKGYLPEAIVNFLALLGWNPGTTQELFSVGELMQAFSLGRVQKSGAVFDPEKLNWLQGQWMRRLPSETFAKRILPTVAEKFPQANQDEQFRAKAELIQERITFFSEAPAMMGFFYQKPETSVQLLANERQGVRGEDLPKILSLLKAALEEIPENEWTRERLERSLLPAIEKAGFKRGQVLWPLRAALTGQAYSPGAFEVAAALGKTASLKRILDAAQAYA